NVLIDPKFCLARERSEDDKSCDGDEHSRQASPCKILRISASGEAAGAYTQRFCSRVENISNFIEAEAIFGPDSRLVYKHFTTLYFVFLFDSSENEVAMLDLIQVFVETLDKCFKNVCELDIVFNYSKVRSCLKCHHSHSEVCFWLAKVVRWCNARVKRFRFHISPHNQEL
ncbi:uncharacterized protein LOC111316469, partial [Durio zibethinus]|uniref:Uncharacterized protein LOC111316469 n=1 Tax=Durio zibethinus TaxID=66656 RepID=A0A6P6BAM6_DURZI